MDTHRIDNPYTGETVAERELLPPSAVEGLVSRATEPGDRRSLRIRLTPAGKRFFDDMTPVHEQWVDALMAGLSRAEMARLLDLLGKLKQSVQAS